MSLDLYREEIDNRLASLRPATEPEPGMFDNFLAGSGKVAMQTFAKAGRAASMAVAPLAMALEKEPGSTEVQDRFFKAHDDIFGNAVDYWTPKPGEVGAAGQVVGQLLGTLPQVFASPALTVAATQLSTGEDLVRKGVDAGTAQAVGGVQAAGLGLGIWVPILGKTLAQRVLLGGAGFNVFQGVATRGASEALLQGTAAEKDFQAFDPTALTLDVLLGAAFGGLAHKLPSMRAEGDAWHKRMAEWGAKLKPSEVDALVTLRQAQHLNADSMPGKPVDMIDADAHVQRMRQAIDDLANDRPVQVEDMPEARFEPDDARMAEANARLSDLRSEAKRVAEADEIDRAIYTDMRGNEFEWPGEAYQKAADDLAQMLDDMGFSTTRDSSRVSMSEYVTARTPDYAINEDTGEVISGREIKFRLSNHELPAHHEQANFDVAVMLKDMSRPDIGGDLTDAVRWAAEKAGVTPSGDAARLISERVAQKDAADKAEAARLQLSNDIATKSLNNAYDFVSRQPENAVIGVSKKLRMTSTVDGIIVDSINDYPREWASGTAASKGKAPKRTKADALAFIESNGGAPTASVDPDSIGSRSLDASRNEMQERPAVRADESGSPEEPAQSGGAAGSDINLSEKVGAGKTALDPLAAEAQRFAAENPDLPIVIGKNADGSDITTTPRQWLEDADSALRQAQDDARLFEIAAGCLLGGGR